MTERVALIQEIHSLLDAFDSDGLSAFCQLHYPDVLYGQFTTGMTLTQQHRILIEHCERQDGLVALTQLRDHLQQETKNPQRFSAPLNTQNYEEQEQIYLERVKERYGYMQILGLSEPRVLKNIYSDVYILGKPMAHKRFDIDELHQRFLQKGHGWQQENIKRKAGLTVVQENQRLFILGKPGAGKTTFLKWLVVHAHLLDRIPVFITLTDLADASDIPIEAVIANEFAICGFPDAEFYIKTLLSSDKAIILFDGLDEVNQEGGQRSNIVRRLQNFTHQYVNCQIIVTCRVAASEYNLTPYKYVEMADFSQTQIWNFVTNWFGGDRRMSNEFVKQLRKRKSLYEMSRTPILLTLLCLIYEESQDFPQKRADIYQEAMDVLLETWDASRGIERDKIYKNLSLGRKNKLLSEIAYEAFEQGMFFIPKRLLSEKIAKIIANIPPVTNPIDVDGEAILKSICAQHGIFVERAKNIYSFAHLTFQEYFTAKQIVDYHNSKFEKLLESNRIVDQRWQEVILLGADLTHNGQPFCDLFLQNLWQIVANNNELVQWFQWLESSDNSYKHEVAILRTSAKRSYSFFLAITIICVYIHSYYINSKPFSPPSHQRTIIGRAIEYAHSIALTIDYANAHNITRIIDDTQKFTTPFFEKDFISTLHVIVRSTKKASRLMHWFQLEWALDTLPSLPLKMSNIKVQNYIYQWQKIIEAHFPLPILNEQHIELLNAYLYGCKLLVDCLPLLKDVDRQAIENELLKPRPNN